MVPYRIVRESPRQAIELRIGSIFPFPLDGEKLLVSVVAVDIDRKEVVARGVDHVDRTFTPGPNCDEPNEFGMFWGDPHNAWKR